MAMATVVRRPKVQKYVVAATHNTPWGGRAVSGALPMDEAEQCRERLASDPDMTQYGPFAIVAYEEAEKKKMYE